MSRFDFACAQHGPAIAARLLADASAFHAFPPGQNPIFNHARSALKKAEKDKSFLKRLNDKKLSPEDIHSYIVPLFHAFALATDPSHNRGSPWKYLGWICRAYINTPVKAEDLYKFKDDLQDLEAFSLHMSIEARSIYHYEDYKTLLDALRPHQVARDKRKAARASRQKQAEAMILILKETTIVYNGPEGKIVIPHTPRASVHWGNQTRWCISGQSASTYFPDYNKRASVYMYLTCPTEQERSILKDFSSYKFAGTDGHMYDERDSSVRFIYPHLARLIRAAEKSVDENMRIKLETCGSYKKFPLLIPEYPAQRNDPAIMLDAVQRNYIAYFYTPGALRAREDIALAAVAQSPVLMTSLPASLRESVSFISKAVAENWKCIEHINPEHRDNPDIIRAAAQKEPESLRYASPRLLSDKDFMLELIRENSKSFVFASDTLKDDPDIVTEAVTRDGKLLRHASFRLKENPVIAKHALSQSSDAIEFIAPSLKADKDIISFAARHAPVTFRSADRSLRSDPEFVLKLMKQDWRIVKHADPSLLDSQDFMLAALAIQGLALEHATARLKGHKDIVLAAVQNNGEAIKYTDSFLRKDQDVALAAVRKNWHALYHLRHYISKNRELILEAVGQDGRAFMVARDSLRADKELVLLAVSSYGDALERADGKLRADKQIVLAAVHQNGLALRHAAKYLQADKDVIAAALTQNPDAAKYVRKSTAPPNPAP